MNLLVSNITWDTEDEDCPSAAPSQLPAQVLVTDLGEDFDPTEQLANSLSDHYGWCVSDLTYEKTEANEIPSVPSITA